MLNTPSLRWQRKHGFFKWNMPPLILHKDTAPYRYGLKTKDLMPNGSTIGQKWAITRLCGAIVALVTLCFIVFTGCAFGAENICSGYPYKPGQYIGHKKYAELKTVFAIGEHITAEKINAFCKAQFVWVDMSIISQIESNNNPMAYNKRSGATGMYQVTPICLKDYNQHHQERVNLLIFHMYEPKYAFIVANWYMNIRIPQMLKAYGIPDTISNRLHAYNAGIGMVKKGIMPKETKDYIRKYERLSHEPQRKR